jgi:hypothetical protein
MNAYGALSAIVFILLASALAGDNGSIAGIVTSANNAAVPGALVTLWSIENGTPVQAVVPNNPQYTSNFSSGLPGAYAFVDVPPGSYNITAAWDGYWYYAAVNLTGGTVTANIVIPERIDVASLAATPTPKTYYTFVPVRLSSPLPQANTARSPGFGALIALASIPVAALIRKRRKCS